MTKDEALEMIAHFEAQPGHEYITRKEVGQLMTAMSMYLLYEISETIVRDSFDSMISNMRKT